MVRSGADTAAHLYGADWGALLLTMEKTNLP